MTASRSGDAILELRHLELSLESHAQEDGVLVSDVSLTVRPGETVGLVGESGSGKTLTLRAAIGLLPSRIRATAGSIVVDGVDLTEASDQDWARVRGSVVSMVFQDPMTSLNPLMSVGRQIAEAGRTAGKSRREADADAVELLARVGIPLPAQRFRSMPHELSGGMRQRVVIAMALAAGAQVVLCDEPTTALDVTIQQQVLALLRDLTRERGTALLYVSHDLAVVAQLCDVVAVMYAGELVEVGPTERVIERPQHPYTAALIAAIPDVAARRVRLRTIEGMVPSTVVHGSCCPFAPRCAAAMPRCATARPQLRAVSGEEGHLAACFLLDAAVPTAGKVVADG